MKQSLLYNLLRNNSSIKLWKHALSQCHWRINPFFSQNGFTVVELVVVIMLLGVLAVTAAPKLINLSSESREAVIKNTEGSIKSAINLVHTKAIMEGVAQLQTATLKINNQVIELSYGYPSAHKGIRQAMELGTIAGYGKYNDNTQYDWVYQQIMTQSRAAGTEIGFGTLSGDGSETRGSVETIYWNLCQSLILLIIVVPMETQSCKKVNS